MTGYIQISAPYENARRIGVTGKMWNWQFTYQLPDGGELITPDLHVEVGEPVELVLESDDVIHSIYIPEFRIKKDAVPGRYNRVWFKPTEVGTYPVYCTEYCGTQHSSMVTRVVVHRRGELARWMREAARAVWADLSKEQFERWQSISTAEEFEAFRQEIAGEDAELAEQLEDLKAPWIVGDELRKARGCTTCHSIDGSYDGGPTWLGLYGSERRFEDAPPTAADENYLYQAIAYPKRRRVLGASGQMPEYPVDVTTDRADREIRAIVAYIRHLGDSPPQ
jgi:cytochrome c oxidase subunit 2